MSSVKKSVLIDFFIILAMLTSSNTGRVEVTITKGCSCNSNTFTTDVLSEIEEVTDVSSQHFLCEVSVSSSSSSEAQQESIVAQPSSSSLAEVMYSKETDDKVSLQ
ncbi:hypothetical protein RCZ04_11170 [Capnocytophaga sp. HP1101]